MMKGNSSNEKAQAKAFQVGDELTETNDGEPLSDRKVQRGRAGDFRIEQLDIGDVENAIYREKWWQIW
jgi:hypothetical protein